MKLPTPPPDNDDEDDTNEVPFVPPSDELFASQQKHQLGERKKALDDLTAYLLNPNPVTLDNIRMRWESGFLNLVHVGPWKSIWDLLHAAKRAPGFCTSGTVFFGYGQGGQQAMDLSQSAKHEKLIVDMARYGVHATPSNLPPRSTLRVGRVIRRNSTGSAACSCSGSRRTVSAQQNRSCRDARD